MITIDKLCNAASVSGWDICLWGNPKLTVLCGHCKGMFATRDYVFLKSKNNQVTVFCPYCHYYNLTGLYEE